MMVFFQKCLKCPTLFGTLSQIFLFFFSDTSPKRNWYPNARIIPRGEGGAIIKRDFSGTEHPIDLRSVYKLEFVQKKQTTALYLSSFSHGGSTNFENLIFQKLKSRFSQKFDKNADFSKKISGVQFES